MTRKTTQSKAELINKAAGKPRHERMSLAEGRDKLYEKFYNNLRVLAAMELISMVDLSRKLNLKSGSRLNDLCYGRGIPGTEELIVLSNYFQCTIDDLLNNTVVVSWQKGN